MQWWRYIGTSGGTFILVLWLIGCSSPVPALPPTENSPSASETSSYAANSGQSLPISAQVKVADQVIQLEVARSQDEQAMGLMFRPKLEDNRGMLFPFSPARPVSFWMKNVRINLDMVFLRDGKVIAIASNVPPCTSAPCPVYGPQSLVDQVIELRGGRAKELGIKPGDRLVVQPL
ncbi:MAG: DUF192 domain-containing protein [Oscillatoriales cyanobacterium C42_A2020_001]|nr:DUF192 domain-containing protein [Leptolyngbyaceae cyanobacterium C42_A2020_001]